MYFLMRVAKSCVLTLLVGFAFGNFHRYRCDSFVVFAQFDASFRCRKFLTIQVLSGPHLPTTCSKSIGHEKVVGKLQ